MLYKGMNNLLKFRPKYKSFINLQNNHKLKDIAYCIWKKIENFSHISLSDDEYCQEYLIFEHLFPILQIFGLLHSSSM